MCLPSFIISFILLQTYIAFSKYRLVNLQKNEKPKQMVKPWLKWKTAHSYGSSLTCGRGLMGWRDFEYLRPELLTVSCSGREIFCDLSLSPF